MITEVYKLVFPDKETAISVLKDKGCSDKEGNIIKFPTHNVVLNIKVPETKATFDSEGNVLTSVTFKSGYHVDVQDERLDLDFGEYRKFPNKEYHTF